MNDIRNEVCSQYARILDETNLIDGIIDEHIIIDFNVDGVIRY